MRFVPLIILFSVLSCEKEGPLKKIVIKEEDPLEVKHSYQKLHKDSWNAETWLWGSVEPVWFPLDVVVRLTPDDKGGDLPKVKVHLEILQNGVAVRKGDFAPEFQECAKMKKRRETIYEPNLAGKVTQFPPKEPCWEATIKDPFKSDRRYPNTTPFEPGEYLITGGISFEKGPQLKIGPMKVKLDWGR
jgi:hypothetical protein